MYICAKTHDELQTHMMYVIEYIQRRSTNAYFIVSGYPRLMIIDCIIEGMKRRLQLIGIEGSFIRGFGNVKSEKNSYVQAYDIIKNFDFTHCQIAFDGNDVICTKGFIDSMMTRQTAINPLVTSIHAYRLVKAYIRGFSILHPEHDVYIKNYCGSSYGDSDKSELKNGSIPARTDKIRHINLLPDEFNELLTNPIVQRNLHKNPMIDFSLSETQRLEKFVGLCENNIGLNIFNNHGHQVYERQRSYEGSASEKYLTPIKYDVDPSLEHSITNMSVANFINTLH